MGINTIPYGGEFKLDGNHIIQNDNQSLKYTRPFNIVGNGFSQADNPSVSEIVNSRNGITTPAVDIDFPEVARGWALRRLNIWHRNESPCIRVIRATNGLIEDCFITGIGGLARDGLNIQEDSMALRLNRVMFNRLETGINEDSNGGIFVVQDCQFTSSLSMGIHWRSNGLIVRGGEFNADTGIWVDRTKDWNNGKYIILKNLRLEHNAIAGIHINGTLFPVEQVIIDAPQIIYRNGVTTGVGIRVDNADGVVIRDLDASKSVDGFPLVHLGPESRNCVITTSMRKMVLGRDVIDEGQGNAILFRGQIV